MLLNLEKERRHKGYTQKKMAQKLSEVTDKKYSMYTYRRIENAETTPNIYTSIHIMKILEIPLDRIETIFTKIEIGGNN